MDIEILKEAMNSFQNTVFTFIAIGLVLVIAIKIALRAPLKSESVAN